MEQPIYRTNTRLPFLNRRSSPTSKRERRFSDADRHSSTITLRPLSFATSNDRPLNSRSQDTSPTDPPDAEASSTNTLSLQPHVCSSSSSSSSSSTLCAVIHVLQTSELLTLILIHLPTSDVQSLRRVSHTWAVAVQSSPQLRQHAFVRPQWARPAESFTLVDLPTPGLMVACAEPLERGQRVRVRMTLAAARRIVPEPQPRPRARSIYEGLRGGLGSSGGGGRAGGVRERDERRAATELVRMRTDDREAALLRQAELLVAQPPIVGMQAFVDPPGSEAGTREGVEEGARSEEEEGETVACAKLACDAGITLGFLAETAQSLLAGSERAVEEPDCVSVEFRTIVSFCPPGTSPRRRGNGRSVIII